MEWILTLPHHSRTSIFHYLLPSSNFPLQIRREDNTSSDQVYLEVSMSQRSLLRRIFSHKWLQYDPIQADDMSTSSESPLLQNEAKVMARPKFRVFSVGLYAWIVHALLLATSASMLLLALHFKRPSAQRCVEKHSAFCKCSFQLFHACFSLNNPPSDTSHTGSSRT